MSAARDDVLHRAGPGPGVPSGARLELEPLIALRLGAHKLDLRAGQRTRDVMAGAQLSRFRGRGMEYSESRAYLPGDDIRAMDWRVTARTGRPHTKVFQEERERPVILVVDLGSSMHFGTRGAFKSVVAGHAAALIAWVAALRGDRVGALVFTDAEHVEVKPAGGRRGVLRVLQTVVRLGRLPGPSTRPNPSRLGTGLQRARRVARPGSLVFVFSDFYGLDSAAEHHLMRLQTHNDLVVGWVFDPLEANPPPAGQYPISDGAATAMLDTGTRFARNAYARYFHNRRSRLDDLCTRASVTLVPLRTGAAIETALGHGLGSATGRRPSRGGRAA